MTTLEKKVGVRNTLRNACGYMGCEDCEFFDPNDTTDGEYWCGIRDVNENIPFHENWDMNSAMI